MPLKIEVTPKEVVSKRTDSRGRLNLGTEYADKEVTVLIADVEDDTDTDSDDT